MLRLLSSALPFPGTGGSPETRRDPGEPGELGDAVRPLQRPGGFSEEKSPAVFGRAAGCESENIF